MTPQKSVCLCGCVQSEDSRDEHAKCFDRDLAEDGITPRSAYHDRTLKRRRALGCDAAGRARR